MIVYGVYILNQIQRKRNNIFIADEYLKSFKTLEEAEEFIHNYNIKHHDELTASYKELIIFPRWSL